jgi:hypothetical protein
MLEWLRYELQLRRLQRRRMTIERGFSGRWHKLNHPRTPNEERDKIEQAMAEREFNEQRRLDLASTYIIEKAAKYFIYPNDIETEEWEESPLKGGRRLNPLGIRRLSATIRAAQKERSDLVRSWLATIAPIVGALTGLIGALIGLLAIILGKR